MIETSEGIREKIQVRRENIGRIYGENERDKRDAIGDAREERI